MELTFYQDYVIVNVPVPGKARQEGWLYRQGTWTGFGGIRATFPGSKVVDTNRLNIPALTRNIARARNSLNVEKPAQAYVIIRFIERVDTVPSVDIHVPTSTRSRATWRPPSTARWSGRSRTTASRRAPGRCRPAPLR